MQKTIALSTILFIALAAIFFTACNNNNTGNNSTEPIANSKEDSMKKVVARGEYLAVHVAVCMHCHSMRDFNKYAGPDVPGTEGGGGGKFDHSILDAIPGTMYSKNITPDSATGIGTWTDDELVRAITQGISKKGDTLFPLMPYANFNRMTKDDLMSIIAYLRTLKPIKNTIPERQLMIPISMAYPAPALQKSIDGNVCPPESDPVKYGGYLVNIAGCSDCHTPYVKGQPDFSHEFAGGNTFVLGKIKVNSSNITPDSATGIGAWGLEAFMKKFTVCRDEKGYNYDPDKLNTIMPVVDYSGMKDSDLNAIYAYLRSVKPVKNNVAKYPQ